MAYVIAEPCIGTKDTASPTPPWLPKSSRPRRRRRLTMTFITVSFTFQPSSTDVTQLNQSPTLLLPTRRSIFPSTLLLPLHPPIPPLSPQSLSQLIPSSLLAL
jgi:hypothetical protein